MTTIQVASDLHFEFYDSLANQNKVFGPDDVNADILVLAGDLANTPSKIDPLCGSKAKVVIVVMGNHEYYGHDLTRIEKWKKELPAFRHAVHVMDNEVVELPEYDLRIIGSTLWASLANGTHAAECKRCIADFTAIRGMTPDLYMNLHRKAVDYIEHVLKTPFYGKTVVVTHHAPSWRSQHHKFAASGVGGLFCSDLEWMMEKYEPALWIHGHTHDPWDYMVGKTRVVCNPSGYMQEYKQSLNKNFVIEL